MKLQILRGENYVQSQWKNGFGETTQLCIYPLVDFSKEPFIWRLSRATCNDDCSFSLFPGYDICLVLLNGHCKLYHNDAVKGSSLKPLVTYTYQGDYPTTCRLDEPSSHLSFVYNRSTCTASVDIETISEAKTLRLVSSEHTLLYCLSGRLAVDCNDKLITVEMGETLFIERDEDSLNLLVSSASSSDGSEEFEVGRQTTFVFVQVHMTRPRTLSSASLLSPTGSLFLYDDQPMGSLSIDNPVQYWESAKLYQPPVTLQSLVHVPPVIKDTLDISEFPLGCISTAWINMMKQGLSEWIQVPVIIARGEEEGPIVGITAVIHGNELNGVPCIHRVMADIDIHSLKGTVVAVPCVNTPGYLRYSREFTDGKDLNRGFPGQEQGTSSQIFSFNFFNKIITKFDYLIDLHTASFGRVNSYYVRADMNDPVASVLAKLQHPQIILHNSGQDGTLRSAASARGIGSITVEIGNPQQFQNQYVQWSYMGVMRILCHLKMFDSIEKDVPPATIICSRGFWIYTNTGGVLEVYCPVNTVVRRGDLIARIKNIFGNVIHEIFSPSNGIVIGCSSNPVANAGDRVAHLGVLKKENEVLAKEAKENY